MLILSLCRHRVIVITCCIFILTSSNAEAAVLKDAFDVVVTIWDLYTQAQKDENERKADQKRRGEQQPEGVLHVYSAWSGIVEPRYVPQPGLETARIKYIKTALLIQNRCNRPFYIEPHLFWMKKYFAREPFKGAGRIFLQQTNRWEYTDYDFGKDVLPSGWIRPGEDVKGYVFSSFRDFQPEFQWNLTYGFTESGQRLSENDPSCTILFH